MSMNTSRLGERANPHPSQAQQYITEVIEENDQMVRVRYVNGLAPAWWITSSAWDDWVRLSEAAP